MSPDDNRDKWNFLNRKEFDRWEAEECQSDEERSIVLEFLARLEENPLAIPAESYGPPFQNRFYYFLPDAPVVVTWIAEREICVVSLVRIESIPTQ